VIYLFIFLCVFFFSAKKKDEIGESSANTRCRRKSRKRAIGSRNCQHQGLFVNPFIFLVFYFSLEIKYVNGFALNLEFIYLLVI
jgi:hypothetical protein